MKTDLRQRVSKLKPGLQNVLDKGFYEQVAEVCGSKIKLHILTKGEEIEISRVAGAYSGPQDLITREHAKQVEHLAHAVSEVNDVCFENLEESREFFFLMSKPMMDAYIKAYQEIVPSGDELVKKLGEELKNSQRSPETAVSGK